MNICEICGNEREPGGVICPFCGARDEEAARKNGKKRGLHKTVNLEQGRPPVDVAIERMVTIIQDARRNEVHFLTLIHGYGSSGKGGLIRVECRKMLDYLKAKGSLTEYVPGEDFSQRSNAVKALLRRYPQLRINKNLNRGNRGITIVVL